MATHVPVLLGGPTPIVMYPSVYPGNPYYPAAVPGMVPQGVPRATSDSVPISQAITPPALSAEEIKEVSFFRTYCFAYYLAVARTSEITLNTRLFHFCF